MKKGQRVLIIVISVILIIFAVLCMFDKENGHSICALMPGAMLLSACLSDRSEKR